MLSLRTPGSGGAITMHNGEELMVGVISQHLLATELHQLEIQLARLRVPAPESEALMRLQVGASNSQTLADCKHLEVTLQAARCEHTAADTALQTALERADELMREASTRLFMAQDQLCHTPMASQHRPRISCDSYQLPANAGPGSAMTYKGRHQPAQAPDQL